MRHGGYCFSRFSGSLWRATRRPGTWVLGRNARPLVSKKRKRCENLVDLEKSEKMRLLSLSEASIQKRTSTLKFARSPCTDPSGLSITNSARVHRVTPFAFLRKVRIPISIALCMYNITYTGQKITWTWGICTRRAGKLHRTHSPMYRRLQ